MDGAPEDSVIDGIRNIAKTNLNVKAVKDVKVRKMGLDIMVDMVIEVEKSISVEKGHAITDIVRKDIMKKMPSAMEVFIHVEPYLK
jgi:divalent metal cation (Fe/Co/Zn/Cd) transporter